MIKFMITDHNREINNNKLTWEELQNKLTEEYKEVVQEINQKTISNSNEFNRALTSELMDLIQMSIVMLERLRKEGMDIEQANIIHNKKLASRKWKNNGIIIVKRV